MARQKCPAFFFLEGRNHLLGFKYMYIHIHVLICYVSFVKVANKVGPIWRDNISNVIYGFMSFIANSLILLRTLLRMHVCMYVSMYVSLYICIFVYMYICIYVCLYILIYELMYLYMNVFMYV